MNVIENEQISSYAWDSLHHGAGRLANFPGLLKKIIEVRAWEGRKIRTGEVVQLKSLAELITAKPLRGWGEDIKSVETVIQNDRELLPMFRKEIGHQGE